MAEAGSDTEIPPDIAETKDRLVAPTLSEFSYLTISTSIYDRIKDRELDFIIIVVTSEVTAFKLKKKILEILNMSDCPLFVDEAKTKSKKSNEKFSDLGIYREVRREYFSLRLSDYPRVILTRELRYAMSLVETANNTISTASVCLFYQFHDKNGLMDTDMRILEPLHKCKNVIQFRLNTRRNGDGKKKEPALNNIEDISVLLRAKFPRTNSIMDTCASCCKYTFAFIMLAMFLMTVLNIVVRKRYNIPV